MVPTSRCCQPETRQTAIGPPWDPDNWHLHDPGPERYIYFFSLFFSSLSEHVTYRRSESPFPNVCDSAAAETEELRDSSENPKRHRALPRVAAVKGPEKRMSGLLCSEFQNVDPDAKRNTVSVQPSHVHEGAGFLPASAVRVRCFLARQDLPSSKDSARLAFGGPWSHPVRVSPREESQGGKGHGGTAETVFQMRRPLGWRGPVSRSCHSTRRELSLFAFEFSGLVRREPGRRDYQGQVYTHEREEVLVLRAEQSLARSSAWLRGPEPPHLVAVKQRTATSFCALFFCERFLVIRCQRNGE